MRLLTNLASLLRRRPGLAAAALAACLPTSAFALGLLQAYELALQNDPTWRAAGHEHAAGVEQEAIARSSLLPQVAASYSNSRNRATITQPDFFGRERTTHPHYRSQGTALQMRAPLFNLEAAARYRQGQAQSAAADAQFAGRAQELMLRVASAYVETLYADDQLALAQAQRDAYAEQFRLNQRLLAGGEGTKTDLIETQSRFDLAAAQVIEAADNRASARTALAAMLGIASEDDMTLEPLAEQFPLEPLFPATLEAWQATALENNAELAMLRHSREAAQQEVARNRAGHAPRVDLVASVGHNEGETLSAYNQESTVGTVGIQLNIPLFTGGAVSASTRQAQANLERAEAEFDARRNQVQVDVRRQFGLVTSGAARIRALETGVQSAGMLVTATQRSIAGGARINLDLLNAKQQRYTALRDLAQARYSYLLALLRLKTAAGRLEATDMQRMDRFFSRASR